MSIQLITGRCVIVMSNYWNEYKNLYIDKNIEYKVSKMFQYSTLKKKNEKTVEIMTALNLNEIRVPDIVLKRIEKHNLPVKFINILDSLNKTISKTDFILFLPVLVINKKISNLSSGTYMFDLKRNQLLLVSEQIPSSYGIDKQPKELSIHWFIDLESSVALFGKSAFFESVKHVSKMRTLFKVFLELDHSIKSEEFDIFMYGQRFTKEVNLNSRLCILLGNDEIIINS